MKTFLAILVVWLLALTAAQVYIVNTHKQFLKFEGMILSDNLKNQIVYDKCTYYLYTVAIDGYAGETGKFPVVRPIYIEKSTYEKLINETRTSLIEKGKTNRGGL